MASRALTDTESRYSSIERECLAVVFGLEKFEYYLYGRKVIVETDHSILEQIVKKNIAEAPARLQRLLLRCMKFDITVRYRVGVGKLKQSQHQNGRFQSSSKWWEKLFFMQCCHL